MSALPPKADIRQCKADVRSGPKGESPPIRDFVDPAEQKQRHIEAEGLSGFKIDEQVDLGRLRR